MSKNSRKWRNQQIYRETEEEVTWDLQSGALDLSDFTVAEVDDDTPAEIPWRVCPVKGHGLAVFYGDVPVAVVTERSLFDTCDDEGHPVLVFGVQGIDSLDLAGSLVHVVPEVGPQISLGLGPFIPVSVHDVPIDD